MQETADGLVEVVVPGWSAITGQTPSKIEIAEATGGSEETAGEETVKGTFANEAEAEGAKAAGRIKKGDLIIIGGREARV